MTGPNEFCPVCGAKDQTCGSQALVLPVIDVAKDGRTTAERDANNAARTANQERREARAEELASRPYRTT